MSDELTLPTGYRLSSFDTVDSTNAEALRRIVDGAPSGDVIWARQQSGGRGRRGRLWHSPPGNLYVTIVVPAPPDRLVGQLAFVAANGAGEAARELLASPELLEYKWPNDLMLDGRKLGGILIEASPTGQTHLVAIGLGLNVDSAPSGLEATCLREFGVQVTVSEILRTVCRSIDQWYRVWRRDGFLPVRERWLEAAHRLGERLDVRFPNGTTLDGAFRGIDQNGALILEQSDGKTELIATGEVLFGSA
jgi:BirA family biotin operon repressor/biotin-[acetyl-CoA-carboxylase] ligase